MRTCINFCKNCGIEYKYQMSGSVWLLDTEQRYNDFEYCPECKKKIVNSLSKVKKKTEIRTIKCNDFNLDECIQFEKEEVDAIRNPNGSFPIARRCFMSMYDIKSEDISKTIYFSKNSIKYYCTYWPKKHELINLSKEVRWDLINDKIYE